MAWLILTFGITTVTEKIILAKPAMQITQQMAPTDIMSSSNNMSTAGNQETSINVTGKDQAAAFITVLNKQFRQINFVLIILAFLFYFLGGYFLYGSLFAAIGAAVDNETDTQQFMLPITIPLILGLFVMINSFINPSGKLAVIFSLIPLTSPIVMMARIPFEVPVIQLLSSAALLMLTFIGTTWLAAKIYRTGILLYGKKVSYRELWKWIKY
jgi:ABC-2 type transport system permease protein